MSERSRTRDLLLEYDMLPEPVIGNLNVLSQQLFALAINSGFKGTEQDFKEKFGSFLQEKQIIFLNYTNFPEVGEANKLYFDLNNKSFYYWENEYIPINITSIIDLKPIDNTILFLNCGSATEVI